MASGVTLVDLLASQVRKNTGSVIEQRNLTRAIGEVTLETQIYGSSTLTITLADPQWELQTSGFLSVKDGVLNAIEVEFPQGTNNWWRLAMVDGTTDVTQPNLTLTFEDVIVAYLRDHWGPITVPPNTLSRAQFIGHLVNQVSRGGGINYICPVLGKGVEQDLGGLKGSKQRDTADRKTNAKKGIGEGASLTIRDKPLDSQQLSNLNIALDVADTLNAGEVATVALVFAGIAETSWHDLTNASGHKGPLQSTFFAADDVEGAVTAFLTGGPSFQAGGAIKLSRTVSDPIEIAVRVEVPSVWPDNAYAKEGDKTYPHWIGEARAIVAAYGGAGLGPQGGKQPPANDTAQLTRGTTDNPDEDSWQCITRLAQEVNWRAFTNGFALYYMSDPQLIARTPSLYVGRSGNRWVTHKTGEKHQKYDTVSSLQFTVDNTSFVYRDGAVLNGKPRRRTRIASPETPSQIILNLFDEIGEYRAGEVFVFQDCGLIDDRWIVADATRNCLTQNYTQYTLIPPTAPTPEQRSSHVPASPPTPRGGTGKLPSGVVIPSASWNPDGKPIAKWIVPILTWASGNGWQGVVTSGYRTAAQQIAAANDFARQRGVPVSSIYPNGPLASNHCKKDYPGGAVDVTQSATLARVLEGYPGHPTLVWGGPVIEDSVHFSATGR